MRAKLFVEQRHRPIRCRDETNGREYFNELVAGILFLLPGVLVGLIIGFIGGIDAGIYAGMGSWLYLAFLFMAGEVTVKIGRKKE